VLEVEVLLARRVELLAIEVLLTEVEDFATVANPEVVDVTEEEVTDPLVPERDFAWVPLADVTFADPVCVALVDDAVLATLVFAAATRAVEFTDVADGEAV
jgi:hypothetical protein